MSALLSRPSSRPALRAKHFPALVATLAAVLTRGAEPRALPAPYPIVGRIERADARFNALLDPQARVEIIADGFRWTEGPVWLPDAQALVFSDVPANTAYRWSELGGVTRFLAPSGYTGPFDGEPHQGSNGLKRDPRGRLLLCQHGDRRIARLEELNTFTTLADRFEGRRFNSPNDLAVTAGGVIFFTDPPYGPRESLRENRARVRRRVPTRPRRHRHARDP